MRKLTSVVVVHRHGARFPSDTSKGNLSFPNCRDFWNSYSMILTPAGSRQLYNLGLELNDYYKDFISNLGNISEKVHVFSTNTSRTIGSCISLLDGLFPSYPKYIAKNGNRDPTFYKNAEHMYNLTNRTLGIKIEVEKSKSKDTLFHPSKYYNSDEYKIWKQKNTLTSSLVKEECDNSNLLSLLDKLYTMGESIKICPCFPLINRLRCITDYNTLIRYSEISGDALLPNKYGMTLTKEEIDYIKHLSNLIYRHHFTPSEEIVDDSYSNKISGLLLYHVINYLYSKEEGIRVYSAHDTTLLALAASLGLIVDSPNFSGYFVFENYSNGEVNVKYCPDPEVYRLKDLVARKLRKDKTYKNFNDLEEGTTRVEDLLQYGFTRDYIRIRDNLLKGNFSCKLDEDVSKYAEMFNFYDTDNDGVLSKEEFTSMYYRFGLESISEEEIFAIYNNITAGENFTINKFMCILN